MPPQRKVYQLPPELLSWLQDEIGAGGPSEGWEDLADRLEARCVEAGLEIRIGKSALHDYGQEFAAHAQAHAQAQREIKAFLAEASLADEVDVTSALFQQLTTLQFRLQMTLADPDGLPDPRGMKDLSQALNNLIRSTSMRDAIAKTVRAEITAAAANTAKKAATEAGLSGDVVDAIYDQVLGKAA